MTIDELIKSLEEIKETHGNLKVYIVDTRSGAWEAGSTASYEGEKSEQFYDDPWPKKGVAVIYVG